MKNNFILKLLLLAVVSMSPTLLLAKSGSASNPIWTWIFQNIFFLIAGMIILGVCMVLWNLMNVMMANKRNEFLRANGIEPAPMPVQSDETFVSRWYKKATNLVPIEKEADIQLDHDYDGIHELDNNLPPWWLYGFYLSILVAIGYIYVYHYSDIGLSQHEEYELAMEEGERQKAKFEARQANNLDENNLVALLDAQSLNVGELAFKANCAACHGQAGEGGVGPNLTDQYWLHGGSTSLIYKTIKYGVPEKGMIAWRAQMQPAIMHKVASYIKTLAGTNPANPKAPQGDFYQEEGNEDLSNVE